MFDHVIVALSHTLGIFIPFTVFSVLLTFILFLCHHLPMIEYLANNYHKNQCTATYFDSTHKVPHGGMVHMVPLVF